MESIYDWLWLLLVFGAGNRKIWKLLEKYETPQKVRQVLQEDPPSFIKEREQRSIHAITEQQIAEILQNCHEKQISVIGFDDENYPESLKQIYHPPIVLFYQGQLSLLTDYPVLTVVGTRKPSQYSIQTADLLCRFLARSGIVLASGFAVGLDSVAHRAALLSGGKTIAVMGCGLDIPYPKPNAPAKKYMIRNGLMLSEFLPGTPPLRQNFPLRNRILAGVSGGTLVIQAPIGSGALITAEQAIEQGKPVFCLPPSDIFDNQYAGVVKYLREGAIPVFAPEDILREYRENCTQNLKEVSLEELQSQSETVTKSEEPQTVTKKPKKLKAAGKSEKSEKSEKQKVTSEKQSEQSVSISVHAHAAWQEMEDGLPKRIMNLLMERSPLQIDQIVQTLQEDAEDVAACLTELAIDQWIERMPGQYYGIL